MKVTQPLQLDLYTATSNEYIKVKQCDTNSRQIQIKLLAGGKTWKIPDSSEIYIYTKKPDGHIVFNPCTIELPENGLVIAPLTEQTLAASGIAKCELYIKSETSDIKSPTFQLKIEPMIYDSNAIESTDEMGLLGKHLNNIQAAIDRADHTVANILEKIAAVGFDGVVDYSKTVTTTGDQDISGTKNFLGYVKADRVYSDVYRFAQDGKVRTGFGTPTLAQAALIDGVFSSKFDFYNQDYIKFYSSDSLDGEDWQDYSPINDNPKNRKSLFNGITNCHLRLELGLHKRYAIEIENNGADYFWLEYFTLMCSSGRCYIAFEMQVYSEYTRSWTVWVPKTEAISILKDPDSQKNNEQYPLEVSHPSIKFDRRVEAGKYQKIRYIFHVVKLYDYENPESSYNQMTIVKLRHFGSYPVSFNSKQPIRPVLDEDGNMTIPGMFRAKPGDTPTRELDYTTKAYVDAEIAKLRAALTNNN